MEEYQMEEFLRTVHYEALEKRDLNIPNPRPLPGSTTPIPFIIVAFFSSQI